MKDRYRLFLRRKSVYYAFDNTTKTFESLKTKDRAEATRLLPKTFFEELSTFHRLPESDTVTTRRPCFRVDNHLRRWPKLKPAQYSVTGQPGRSPPKRTGEGLTMETKLPTAQEWEEAAKTFNFKDNRVSKKLTEFEKIPKDAYDEQVSCLAEVRHLAKVLSPKTQNATKFLADLIQAVDKTQSTISKAQKAAKAQADNAFTPQEAANMLRKVKFAGLKWDPKKLQQAHQAIDKAITASHWKAHTHFAKRVLERGPKYNIHDGDDLQTAIHAGRSQPGRSQHGEEGKFEHHITHGGFISYNPATRTIITLV